MINVASDLVCLQLPVQSRQPVHGQGPFANPYGFFSSTEKSWGVLKTCFSAIYPGFMALEKLCFEIPPLWVDCVKDNPRFCSLSHRRTRGAYRNFLDTCKFMEASSRMLLDFPSLKTVYFLDSEIILKSAFTPSSGNESQLIDPSCEVFDGPEESSRFVEVKRGNEEAWVHKRCGSLVPLVEKLYSHDPFGHSFPYIYDQYQPDLAKRPYTLAAPFPYAMTTREALFEDIKKTPTPLLKFATLDYIRFGLEQQDGAEKPTIKLLAKVDTKALKAYNIRFD